MLKLRVIHDQTGESQEKDLIPKTLIQGGGLIGRHDGCDIVLNSPDVSRVHARVVYREGQYYFSDLGSTSGSQVNNTEAPTNQNFLLQPNDIIRIGEFIIKVEEVKVDSDTTTYPPHRDQVVGADNTAHPVQRTRVVEADNATYPPHKTQVVEADNAAHPPHRIQVLEVNPAQTGVLAFKAEELKAQGFDQGAAELVVHGKLLVKGLSFAMRFHEKAIELCQAELDAGRFCLLVEHVDHITIWQEKQVEQQDNSDQHNS